MPFHSFPWIWRSHYFLCFVGSVHIQRNRELKFYQNVFFCEMKWFVWEKKRGRKWYEYFREFPQLKWMFVWPKPKLVEKCYK